MKEEMRDFTIGFGLGLGLELLLGGDNSVSSAATDSVLLGGIVAAISKFGYKVDTEYAIRRGAAFGLGNFAGECVYLTGKYLL